MSDHDHRLNDDVREALKAVPFPAISAENLAWMRATRYEQAEPPVLSDKVERRNVVVPGPAGAPDIELRVHRPAGVDGPLPCLYWMHGGGLIMGNNRQDDLRFDHWCDRHRIVAVSVEYRLAPETPYPGAIEDSYAGLVWVQDHAAELGIDVQHMGIGGPSAGGGLTAALALLSRDRGLPAAPLRSQLLIYPMLDPTVSTPSAQWDVPIWPPQSNRFGWSSYLAGVVGDIPAYAAASRATDLAGLPPAYMFVGGVDGFVDEDLDYARRLNHAGVEIELHVYPGAPHGFDGFLTGTHVAKQANRELHQWLARTYAR
jgi:triacylglycerol lipase